MRTLSLLMLTEGPGLCVGKLGGLLEGHLEKEPYERYQLQRSETECLAWWLFELPAVDNRKAATLEGYQLTTAGNCVITVVLLGCCRVGGGPAAEFDQCDDTAAAMDPAEVAVLPGYGGGGLTVKFMRMEFVLVSAVDDAVFLLPDTRLLIFTNNPTGPTPTDQFVLFVCGVILCL